MVDPARRPPGTEPGRRRPPGVLLVVLAGAVAFLLPYAVARHRRGGSAVHVARPPSPGQPGWVTGLGLVLLAVGLVTTLVLVVKLARDAGVRLEGRPQAPGSRLSRPTPPGTGPALAGTEPARGALPVAAAGGVPLLLGVALLHGGPLRVLTSALALLLAAAAVTSAASRRPPQD